MADRVEISHDRIDHPGRDERVQLVAIRAESCGDLPPERTGEIRTIGGSTDQGSDNQ
jgi:hypothetical protein